MKAVNRSRHKAALLARDAREHRWQGGAGRDSAKRAKRLARRAARRAEKSEAAWVKDQA
jgi:hypothetical protein